MTALATVVSLIALIYLGLFLYNEHRVDHLRQDLFCLRDELFDEAAAGVVDFRSPTYRATREFLNGGIRYAHRLSISRFFAFRLMFSDRLEIVRRSSFQAHFVAGSAADQALCRSYVERAHIRMAAHLVKSPFMLVGFVPALVYQMLNHGYNVTTSFVAQWRKQFSVYDDVAYRAGQAAANGNGNSVLTLLRG